MLSDMIHDQEVVRGDSRARCNSVERGWWWSHV